MTIYLFMTNVVLWAWQWSDYAHLQYVLRYQETCVPSFIKISKFLLKLQLAQTDGRTDSHPDFNSSLHPDVLYIHNHISNLISFR